MAGSRIVSLGHYQPSRVLTNDDLAQMVDTSDAWIRDRVGIATRRIAAGEETVADMAGRGGREGARRLRPHRRRHRPGRRRHLLLCGPLPQRRRPGSRPSSASAPRPRSTSTPPARASRYALATVDHAIRAGAARNAIVIGAEKLSDFTDWTDRSTCIIFGDGAGAAVVTAAADGEPTGIGPVVWGSAPERSDAIRIEGWRPYIQQEGQAVFRWATTALAPIALQACERAGVDPSEIAAFVAHQANARIIDGIAKRLNLPNAVIAKDIVESGNTSAASVPLALSKLVERREVPSGAPVLLFGFGGGLTYAGQVVRCP